MDNINELKEDLCTGCGACVSVCPFSAIEYKINSEGFFKANVNEKICRNCGVCKKVCAKFQDKEGTNVLKSNIYSAYSKNDDVVRKTTSGGIAYEIAKYGLENGYYIVGTIFDEKNNKAKAILTNKLEDLEKIKGSKYLQSDTGDVWTILKQKVKDNKKNKFIVFGTPCQIYGISKLIECEKINNEIITIDLFCHGVPSYNLWNKYIVEEKAKYQLNNIIECDFRNKKYGWHQFCMQLMDETKVVNIDSRKVKFL